MSIYPIELSYNFVGKKLVRSQIGNHVLDDYVFFIFYRVSAN